MKLNEESTTRYELELTDRELWALSALANWSDDKIDDMAHGQRDFLADVFDHEFGARREELDEPRETMKEVRDVLLDETRTTL